MKKLLTACLLVSVLASCNNDAKGNNDPVDSLEKRKDTLINKIDSTTEAKIDSLKDRAENMKDKFDASYEAKKDSVQQ